MPTTVTVYTLAELKKSNPEAFEEIHKKWQAGCTESNWASEVMDSLNAVVKACGARMKNWSIGPYNNSSIRIGDVDDRGQDLKWFKREVLKPNGYPYRGKIKFAGLCKLTGYCADDDFLEQVYKELVDGATMTDALESLAHVAQKHFENDLEQQQDEENMMANWEDRLFTFDGKAV